MDPAWSQCYKGAVIAPMGCLAAKLSMFLAAWFSLWDTSCATLKCVPPVCA